MTDWEEIEESDALKRIIQACRKDSLIAKGLHEVCKACHTSDQKLKAKYIILASNCHDHSYLKLVKHLAKKYEIPLLRIKFGETLGEYLGLCKYDKNKNIRKRTKCSSVAIRDFS